MGLAKIAVMKNRTVDMQSRDYDRVASAIRFLQENYRRQPSLDEIAEQIHLTPHHFQKLFSRWVGVSPKKFLEVLTLNAAKTQLRKDIKPLLDISLDLGLSSSSRLHDHFVQLEGVTPDQYRRYGQNLQISYGLSASPFGDIWTAHTPRGICRAWFDDLVSEKDFVSELRADWSDADLHRDDEKSEQVVAMIFPGVKNPDKPISLLVKGTNFQISVWNALLKIPFGGITSYAEIANSNGSPRAVRAVGSAIGNNPVAFLIPCHRVIRGDGALGGYRGGLIRKEAMLAWEQLKETQARSN